MLKLLIPPPFVAVAFAIAQWFASKYVPALDFDFPFRVPFAIVFAIGLLVLNFSSIRLFMRSNTTFSPVAPEKAEKLITSGMYQYSRNPMYVGLAGIIAAIGVWIGNFLFVPFVLIFIWYMNEFQIKPEEAALESKFGDEYLNYKNTVRRWL